MSVSDPEPLTPDVWTICAETLSRLGVRTIFGMVSEGVGLLEAASMIPNMKIYTTRDQRVAVAAAMGYAQASRNFAVYTTGPGPSLANSCMGISEAYSAAIPMLVISSGVAMAQRGTGAFQELDALRLVSPITKWQYRVEHCSRLIWAIRIAIQHALAGKPGPVFIEIPNDLQLFQLGDDTARPLVLKSQPPVEDIQTAARVISQSGNVVMISGGGCLRSDAGSLLDELANLVGAALFTTASGRGSVSEDHALFCGLVGLYTTPPADTLLKDADVVFVVGSQLEETAVMGWDISKRTTVIQIDTDPASIGRSLRVDIGLLGDALLTLNLLLNACKEAPLTSPQKVRWREQISEVKNKLRRDWATPVFSQAPVRALFSCVNEIFGEEDADSIIVQENGLHDLWGYHYPVLTIRSRMRTLTPGEQTGLSLSVGQGLGAKAACPDAYVVVIVGDGSFQMSRSAVLTAAEHNLSVAFVVLNNRGFSWPRLQQITTGVELGCGFLVEDSLEALAGAAAIPYIKPSSHSELRQAIRDAKTILSKGGLALIEVSVGWDQDLPVGVGIHYGES